MAKRKRSAMQSVKPSTEDADVSIPLSRRGQDEVDAARARARTIVDKFKTERDASRRLHWACVVAARHAHWIDSQIRRIDGIIVDDENPSESVTVGLGFLTWIPGLDETVRFIQRFTDSDWAQLERQLAHLPSLSTGGASGTAPRVAYSLSHKVRLSIALELRKITPKDVSEDCVCPSGQLPRELPDDPLKAHPVRVWSSLRTVWDSTLPSDWNLLLAEMERTRLMLVEALRADRQKDELPALKPHDRQAWQLATLYGMTQDKVGAALNQEHGTMYTQGQVSRMIARVKAHADANGLAEKVAGPIDRPRTVDPGRLELGARVDKRKPRPSDMTRANDDDE